VIADRCPVSFSKEGALPHGYWRYAQAPVVGRVLRAMPVGRASRPPSFLGALQSAGRTPAPRGKVVCERRTLVSQVKIRFIEVMVNVGKGTLRFRPPPLVLDVVGRRTPGPRDPSVAWPPRPLETNPNSRMVTRPHLQGREIKEHGNSTEHFMRYENRTSVCAIDRQPAKA
jgi:hypothetical protein